MTQTKEQNFREEKKMGKMKLPEIKVSTILYSTLFLITGILIIALSVWAALGSNAGTNINYVEGELVIENTVRTEFLVGEEISTDGITLKVGRKTYAADEIEIAVDNTAAGDKMAEVFHESGNNHYRAYLPVKYFAIRHLDIRQKPTGAILDEEGNPVGVQGMLIWAELSGLPQPASFEQPDEPGLDTVIILSETDYTVEVTQNDMNVYIVNIACGNVGASVYFVQLDEEIIYLDSPNFYYLEVNGERIIYDGPNRVLQFTNESETDATLTLYVTSWGVDDGGNGRINVGGGVLVYEDTNGIQLLELNYYMSKEDWGSYFSSKDASVYRRGDDDALIVEFGGFTFNAPRTGWCLAFLNNPNP